MVSLQQIIDVKKEVQQSAKIFGVHPDDVKIRAGQDGVNVHFVSNWSQPDNINKTVNCMRRIKEMFPFKVIFWDIEV